MRSRAPVTAVREAQAIWSRCSGFRRRGWAEPVLALLSALTLSTCAAGAASAQVVRDDLFVTDGNVRAMTRSGNTLYIGGEFSRVGPSTGAGVPIDVASGLPVSGFPKIAGSVHAVAPDGAGGWYVGGEFRVVGGTPRSNLAHVLADHTLGAWDPGADGAVTKLVVSGTTVYAAGRFGHVAGQARNGLAALDATTGLATGWDPDPDGEVLAIVPNGTTVYVGGWFTSIGGKARNALAALDASSGLATTWAPEPDAGVAALVLSDGTLYAGGWFILIGGQPRNHLAAVDTATGLATSWDPNLNGPVLGLAASSTHVFASGEFNYLAGAYWPQGLGAFDVTTGLPIAWRSSSFAGDPGSAGLLLDGSTLYVCGGATDAVSQASRAYLAAVDATTGELEAWDPAPNGPVTALAASGATVFAGGEFTSLGGQARHGLAALDVTTGAVTDWAPDVKSDPYGMRISALAANGSTLYVGGRFRFSFPVPNDTPSVRTNLAAFELATGQPTAWNPNGIDPHEFPVRQRIAALAVAGSRVYVGGRFNTLAGQTRNFLAALDGVTGEAIEWNPSPTDSISVITVHGDIVYVGGSFDSIGAQPRSGLAALDATRHDSTDAITLAWAPQPWPEPVRGGTDIFGRPLNGGGRGTVSAIAVSDTTVFVGGPFESLGGTPLTGGRLRHHLAAVGVVSGSATDWDAGFIDPPTGSLQGPEISSLVASGGAVYVAGSFGGIGGQPHGDLAALDAVTALPTAWAPDADGIVHTLLVDGSTVFAGGAFRSIGGQPQSGVAAMGDLTTPVQLALVNASAEPGHVRLMWYSADGHSLTATVYRRATTSDWTAVARITGDGTGRLVYEDTQVSAATRYGYRLGVQRAGGEEFLGEAWVVVPASFGFALLGPGPNPTAADVRVAFSLPDASPARVELLDIAGRRLAVRDVGALGAGDHLVSLAPGRTTPAGVYLVRLSRGGQSVTARVLVLR